MAEDKKKRVEFTQINIPGYTYVPKEGDFRTLSIVVGINRTGKSSFTIEKLIRKNPNRTIIFNPNAEPKWNIFKKMTLSQLEDKSFIRNYNDKMQLVPENRIEISPYKKFMPYLIGIWENFRDGLLVIDDARLLVDAAVGSAFHTMLISYGQKNFDVIAIFHSLGQVPPKVIDHTNGTLFLFKSNDRIEDVLREKVPSNLEEPVRAAYNILGKHTFEDRKFAMIKF